MSAEEWVIERLVPGGDGLSRLSDGRIGFATGAIPGDRIRPTQLVRHKSWVRAEKWQLLAAGPARVEPRCQLADLCGGCDWMHLERSAQVAAKSAILREALTRTGGFRTLPADIQVVTAGEAFGYRTRLRLHVDSKGKFGLYEKRSHRVVELAACPVSADQVQHALCELRDVAARHPGAFAQWAELELRAAPAGPPITLTLRRREPELDLTEPARRLLEELCERFTTAELGTEPPSAHDQRWSLPGGIELRSPPGGFVQVNWAINQALVEALVRGARARDVHRFCDLYCGAGNFTLPLLAAGLEGLGIEQASGSIRAARRAARAAGLSDQSFIAADVTSELERRAAHREQFDLVVLDPPRAGARESIPLVAKLAPRFIAMCSCDPVTLARDLKSLREAGYELTEVTGFDMFPQTHHVEALAWMQRSA